VPYVFDVEDLQPDAAAELGMLPHRVLPLLYRIERLAYRRATLISTLTEGMRCRIISKGITPDRVVIFPPRADEQLSKLQRTTGTSFRSEHGVEGKFLVVHSGNMGVKQGLGVVLEAAALLKEKKNIAFLLVGSGAMKAQLQERAGALRLENLKFLPLQADERFRDMLATTDLALVVQQRTASDTAFPSKVVTLLTAGCPVLASVNSGSEVARIIDASGAGIVVTPGEAATLAETVYQLSCTPNRLHAMRVQARRYALAQWSPDRVLPAMEAELLKAARMPERSARELRLMEEQLLPDGDD
jgi:colanic acid biosynthesis glycosyl transferase WcaI